MAIDKPIGEPNTDIEVEEVDIETPEFDVEEVEMQEDGSAIINPGEDEEEVEFDSNLADYIEENDLKLISTLTRVYKIDGVTPYDGYGNIFIYNGIEYIKEQIRYAIQFSRDA